MSTSLKFSVNESIVCLRDDLPYSANISGIEEDHYVIHYQNTSKRYDERVEIGKERGKMFKGTVEDFERKKSGIGIARDSMDKENKRKRAIQEEPGTSGKTTPRPLFALHDLIVCLHYSVPYAAKITSIKEDHYVVHYCGYKESQDEKIKFGMEKGKMFNMHLEEYGRKFKVDIHPGALEKERLNLKSKKMVDSGEAPIHNPESQNPEEPKETIWDIVSPAYQLEEPIELTENLMEVLKTDYVNVMSRKMLPVVPVEYTVERIMEEYSTHLEQIRRENNLENTGQDQYYRTLIDYFNDLFSRNILITPERDQHIERVREVLKSKKIKFTNLENVHRKDYLATKDYGIAHLLRLIYRFHELMKHMPYGNKGHVERVKTSIDDFVRFLDQNLERYYDRNGYTKNTD